MLSTDHSPQEQKERVYVRMRADELRALLTVQQAITSHLELNVVLKMIADESRRLTGSGMGAVYLLRGNEGNKLEIAVVSGEVAPEVCGIFLPVKGSLAGRAVQSGEAVLVEDASLEDQAYMPLVEKVAARSFVIVPLVSTNGVLGVITVASKERGSLNWEAVRLLKMFAPAAVIALENARANELAQQMAVVEERQRLARDLHDSLAQTLFSASLIADVLPRIWEKSPVEGRLRLSELCKLTRGALSEMSSLLIELNPDTLLKSEFGELICRLCSAFTARTQIPVKVQVNGSRTFPPKVQLALYRAVQDLLGYFALQTQAHSLSLQLSLGLDGVTILLWSGDRTAAHSQPAVVNEVILATRERVERVGGWFRASGRPGEGLLFAATWPNDMHWEGENAAEETYPCSVGG